MNFNEVDASELKNCIKANKPVRIVDVRSTAELASGVIEGAESLPLHMIPISTNMFKTDEHVVFVCRSGARSAQATMFMQQKGFNNVCNLRGGMNAWNLHS